MGLRTGLGQASMPAEESVTAAHTIFALCTREGSWRPSERCRFSLFAKNDRGMFAAHWDARSLVLQDRGGSTAAAASKEGVMVATR